MLSVIYLTTVSSVCTGMGLYLLVKRIALFTTAYRATGYFVRWEQRGLRRLYNYPVIRFQAHDGQEYEFVGEPGTSSKNRKEKYKVFYPPQNPSSAMIHSLMAYWLAPIVFFILAAGTGAAALKQ